MVISKIFKKAIKNLIIKQTSENHGQTKKPKAKKNPNKEKKKNGCMAMKLRRVKKNPSESPK